MTGAIKDQLLHMDDLALYLINFLRKNHTQSFYSYSRLDRDDLDTLSDVDFLLALAQRWGMKDDYDAASERLIYDFRKNKICQASLDLPFNQKKSLKHE